MFKHSETESLLLTVFHVHICNTVGAWRNTRQSTWWPSKHLTFAKSEAKEVISGVNLRSSDLWRLKAWAEPSLTETQHTGTCVKVCCLAYVFPREFLGSRRF